MTKRTIYHTIEWIIALAGCGFLIAKVATYDDYGALVSSFRSMSWSEGVALVLSVLLMPVNMTIEAWRWRTLMGPQEMHWREAHRQVYYSKLAGLITPWRLGEYPARGVLMGADTKDDRALWKRVLSMGAVGSVTMTAAIVLTGLIALALLLLMGSVPALDRIGIDYPITISVVLVLLLVAMIVAPKVLSRWTNGVSGRLMIVNTGQSIVRVVCWCMQLALLVSAFSGLEISNFKFQISNLLLSAVYYLFVTITPNVPIAEVGVRGAWAIVVFGTMNAALAGVALWAINTLLPCLIWPFLRKK